jgi:hypothetical protein
MLLFDKGRSRLIRTLYPTLKGLATPKPVDYSSRELATTVLL